MPLPDELAKLLNDEELIETSHEFEVDLNCLVTTNHQFTMEGIARAENEGMAAAEESLKSETTDYDMVSSIFSAHRNFYDDLRVAARNLALVGLITRLHHWAGAYARRIDPNRKAGNSIHDDLNFLNGKLGAPPVATDFFSKLAEVRHSVIHADSLPQWTFKGSRGVDPRYAPNGYRVEVSDEDLKDAIKKQLRKLIRIPCVFRFTKTI